MQIDHHLSKSRKKKKGAFLMKHRVSLAKLHIMNGMESNKRVWPLRGRPLWGRPCSWVRVTLLALLDIFRRKVKQLVEDFFANCAIREGRENLRHPADMALPERDSGAIWWVQVRHYKLRTYASGAIWWMIMFYWAFCETSQKPYGWDLWMIAAVTLTSDPLALKLVHGVLVSQGPFLPSWHS